MSNTIDVSEQSALSSNEQDLAAFEKLKAGGKEMHNGYEFLYRKYKPKLRHFYMRQGVSDDTANDLVQETFLTFFKYYYNYQQKSALNTYLYVIAKNKLYDYFQKNKPTEEFDDQFEDRISTLELDTLEECVYRAFNEFRKHHFDCAQTIMLSVYTNLSGENLAEILDRSVSAAYEYISQCKKKFKKFVTQCYEYIEGESS